MYQAGFGGDVGSELKLNAGAVTDCAYNVRVDFCGSQPPLTKYRNAVKMFAVNESAVSIYLYHRLLG